MTTVDHRRRDAPEAGHDGGLDGAGRADLAERFRGFSAAAVTGASPLYRQLALGVAEDPELLDLMAHARPAQRRPVLLFAAVHYLLLRGADHELARFYPSLVERPAAGDPRPAFRDFCLGAARATVAKLLASRATQTNEVGRSAVLYPGLLAAADERPVALVEVGASAGLNLLLDRYGYRYRRGGGGRGTTGGAAGSELVVDAATRGAPPPAGPPPPVRSRLGIDPCPLDVRDDDDVTWLAACVWPEDVARRRRLDRAVRIARDDPPHVRRAVAAEGVAAAGAGTAPEELLCVLHSAVMSYLDREQQRSFVGTVEELGRTRDLAWLSMESPGWRSFAGQTADGESTPGAPTEPHMLLRLVAWRGGRRRERTLARAHPHGRWIEWLRA